MGTSMGTRFAPQYANLFMAKLEEDFLSTCNTKPLTYLRYIDDIFIIWTDSEQELIHYSHTHIHFLDRTIHIRKNTIHTTIYRKPKDKPSYIMYVSYHPDHTKHSTIYSQALRYNRFPEVTFYNLQYKQKPEINQVPLVVTYNPHLRTLRKIARDLQGTLHKDERLKSILPKSLITRSTLLHPTKYGTYPCGKKKKQCKTCPHILTSDKIPIPDTLEDYSIHGHYNCSSNVVYLIQCTKCITGGLYIGETGQSLRKRNTHRRFTITNKKLDTPIRNHFNGPHHSIKDLRILVLKCNFKTDNERKVWEYKLTETFNSLKN
ncbi:hypothetical protein XELAEV_18033603mg [Xenopus laevis]|uniref:Reverse transcriptase domain-containing protein n=1 Tax=Xenopus laevis TaxID=8355 RepID=A0A974CJX4_XENLA|nr:hypothetical protein XELAEV_18033603mg [Xenopus laevis]